MSNPAIPRDVVHAHAEACSDAGEAFQSTASRLIKQQRRLSRYFEQNGEPLGPIATQVAIYMLSVCIRVFEQVGGRMRKVSGAEIAAAQQRVEQHIEALMPADGSLNERAKAIEGRAQPHLLDEVLWALYERGEEDTKEDEQTFDPEMSALMYILLWTAVEALDASWTPPAVMPTEA